MTERQRVEYRHHELLWQLRATVSRKPGDPPRIPPLLRGKRE